MKTLFFDLISGASGDMLLSSLIDAGADLGQLQNSLARMGIEGLAVETEKVRRGSVMCTHLKMRWDTPAVYRHLPQLLEIIQRGNFSQVVQEQSRSILEQLAAAEAKVHGIPVERVHFHEVGAVDTIIDVVGIALCLEQLKIDRICFADVTIGQGTVKGEHGIMPIPVPAVSAMLVGYRTRPTGVEAELVTPTGCAVLTALGEQVGAMPAGVVSSCGYGCGDREFAHHPNVLRCFMVNEQAQEGVQDSVWVIESDMDHVSAEVMAHAGEECFAQGALDVSWSPVFMKKGRPGYRMSVLCAQENRDVVARTIISQTRTLGVRYYKAERLTAQRQLGTIAFLDEQAQEKTCTYGSLTFRKLEYESLARIARRTGRALPDIIEEYVRSR